MSRFIVGAGFAIFDVAATIMSLLSSSGALILLFVSVLSSLLITCMSVTVRSLFWPTYFWDEPQAMNHGASSVRRAGQRRQRQTF